jgi:hypothetical protein
MPSHQEARPQEIPVIEEAIFERKIPILAGASSARRDDAEACLPLPALSCLCKGAVEIEPWCVFRVASSIGGRWIRMHNLNQGLGHDLFFGLDRFVFGFDCSIAASLLGEMSAGLPGKGVLTRRSQPKSMGLTLNQLLIWG